MSNAAGSRFNRRTMLRSSAALLAGSAAGTLLAAEPAVKNVNTLEPVHAQDHRHALRGD